MTGMEGEQERERVGFSSGRRGLFHRSDLSTFFKGTPMLSGSLKKRKDILNVFPSHRIGIEIDINDNPSFLSYDGD